MQSVSSSAMEPFPRHIRELRTRIFGKQIVLAIGVGCTDAAVSQWESGQRLPSLAVLSKILESFRVAGARPTEIAELRQAWLVSAVARTSPRTRYFVAESNRST